MSGLAFYSVIMLALVLSGCKITTMQWLHYNDLTRPSSLDHNNNHPTTYHMINTLISDLPDLTSSSVNLQNPDRNYDIITNDVPSVALENPSHREQLDHGPSNASGMSGLIPILRYQFDADVALFCIGAACASEQFTGKTTIFIDHDTQILTFDHLSLSSITGNRIRGKISFNMRDPLNQDLIESNIVFHGTGEPFSIDGESAASFVTAEDSHPEFAGFQLRDEKRGIILDMHTITIN